MLSTLTPSASEMTGAAVFRMVVSSDSMKKATATSQGSMRLVASSGGLDGAGTAGTGFFFRVMRPLCRKRPMSATSAAIARRQIAVDAAMGYVAHTK